MESQQLGTAAETYRLAIEVARMDLFGSFPDNQLPKHLHEDALVPFLGFAGAQYQPGRVLLLAINPGGGTEEYDSRRPQDSELIPHILAFKTSVGEQVQSTFSAMSSSYMKQAKTWNLWRIIQPVLDACERHADEIAFANIFPFRTHKDHRPHAKPLGKAIDQITIPLAAGLRAGTVVALGKKAGDALQGHTFNTNAYFVVPRTNGDSYISAEAKIVLSAIREHVANQRVQAKS